MRIVHVDTGAELRGGQRQLLLLARGLRKRGHEQLIVCPRGSRLQARARDERFAVLESPGSYWHVAALRCEIESRPPEVLHAHDGRGQTIAWLASRRTGARRVAHRRVTFVPRAWSGGKLIHRLKYTRTCHAVIAVSEFVRRILVGCGVHPATIAVIPDGVELADSPPDPAARRRIRSAWGFDDAKLVLGTLSAATPEKGLDVALAAARLLQTRLPQGRFVLPRPAASLDPLPANVRLLEYVENFDEFFPAIDLFVMPSRNEGLGSSALIAMSWGVPVVASGVGGLPEIVEAGESGWLVRPGSPDDLAEAIVQAAQNRDRLEALGRNARSRAAAFSSDVMTDRVLELYERLLGSRRDGSSVNPSLHRPATP